VLIGEVHGHVFLPAQFICDSTTDIDSPMRSDLVVNEAPVLIVFGGHKDRTLKPKRSYLGQVLVDVVVSVEVVVAKEGHTFY